MRKYLFIKNFYVRTATIFVSCINVTNKMLYYGYISLFHIKHNLNTKFFSIKNIYICTCSTFFLLESQSDFPLTIFCEHKFGKLMPFSRNSVTLLSSDIHGVKTIRSMYHPAQKPATKNDIKINIRNHIMDHKKFPP